MPKLKQVSVFMWPLYPGSQVSRAGYAFSPAAAIGLGSGSVPNLGDENAELWAFKDNCMSAINDKAGTIDCVTLRLSPSLWAGEK